jgi:hypothetical protein
MKVTLNEEMSEITLTLPISPRPSKSGKTTVVATSSGNQTFSDIRFDGKPITVGVNAYIPK